MVFVHGQLVVTIFSASHLPSGEDYGCSRIGCGVLGRALAKCVGDYNDAFVEVEIAGQRLITTSILPNTRHPVWNETFYGVPVCHDAEQLDFKVRDRDLIGTSILADGALKLSALVNAPRREVERTLVLVSDRRHKRKGKLKVRVKYVPCSLGPADPAVPDVYFKPLPGNRVMLYQDAHNEAGDFPDVRLPDGSALEVRSCWADMCEAMLHAENFILITGWSVRHDIQLVRPHGPKLSEVLLQKAAQGVEVCLMVWDDRTSTTFTGGMMGTHDEITRAFFSGTSVKCELVGRTAGDNSFLKSQAAMTFFSHHQKTVLCDAAPLPGRKSRRLVAFVGGLDLTTGRYDSAEHSLFRTRDGVHAGDYHNSSFDCKNGWGPRQPWRDIHCRIDGPGALQVLKNFTERWVAQAEPNQDLKLDIPEVDDCMFGHDRDAFVVQVLRSIDSRSARFASIPTLASKKGRQVDNSVLLGYVHQIRRAQEFIYIENQYFLGSCYIWTEQQESGCSHPIPAEIIQKLVSKIQAGQRFAVYIVLPLFPEGNPADGSMQAILHFQKLTMEAMYARIAAAIRERRQHDSSFDALPTDYLSFFCLGNRETSDGWTPPPGNPPRESDPCYLSAQSRRFMIYVHSKLMITDDEHAIVGSANINMRSMAGTRDTEIAAALWQPAHRWQGPSTTPRGLVHGFRLSVWAQHLCGRGGQLEEVFERPAALDCVRRVRQISEENWEAFISEQVQEMSRHLMCYPIDVHLDGTISERQDTNGHVPDFPDAPLFGERSNIIGGIGIPFSLTT